jgi:hypothetical protein
MSGQLIIVRNMMAPRDPGSSCIAAGVEGLLVTEALARSEFRIPPNTVLWRKGALVPRVEWDAEIIEDDESAMLIVVPQGHGGGASQIVAMLATLVLMVFAPQIGAGLLGAEEAATPVLLGITAGQLATIGIMVVGQLLISTLLGAPKSPGGGKQPSPTYTLNAQANRARLADAIPEWFGRIDIFPDLAAEPYFD